MVLVSPHGRRPKRLVCQLVISQPQQEPQPRAEEAGAAQGPGAEEPQPQQERRAAISQICPEDWRDEPRAVVVEALLGPVRIQAELVVVAEELSPADPAEEDRVAASARPAASAGPAASAVAAVAAVAAEGEEAD